MITSSPQPAKLLLHNSDIYVIKDPGFMKMDRNIGGEIHFLFTIKENKMSSVEMSSVEENIRIQKTIRCITALEMKQMCDQTDLHLLSSSGHYTKISSFAREEGGTVIFDIASDNRRRFPKGAKCLLTIYTISNDDQPALAIAADFIECFGGARLIFSTIFKKQDWRKIIDECECVSPLAGELLPFVPGKPVYLKKPGMRPLPLLGSGY